MTAAAENLAAALEARAVAGGWAGDLAFVAGDRAFSHAEVHDGAARAASLLAGLGAGAGDRVLLAVPDGVEFGWTFLGAIRLGALAVPVNPRLTEADHRFAADDTAARVVVCGDDLAPRFAGRPVVAAGSLETLLAGLPPRPAAPVGPGQAAYAQYTSGTTGPPKAALHGHGDPLVYFDAFARRAVGLDRTDVVLSVSKLYFAYGLGNSLFFPLLSGARAVLHAGHPRPADVAELVRRHGATVLFAVPTFYAHLVALNDPGSMASVRAAVSAGEPLTPALAEKARATLGCPILDGIGSTEVGQTFASNTLERWEDGTVGRALPPYRVSVRDGDGRDAAPGQVGDLWVRGPTVGLGYLGRPAATLAGGWLRTGDRAELSADGVLRLHGRSDDIELVGGISVSPIEVEAVLATHPGVMEVAVAGRVGADGTSQLHAFVVPGTGIEAGDGLAAELVDLARSQLAPFKVPRSVLLVGALPRTSTGKLRRFVLRGPDWPAAPSVR
ncbi:MAG: benzoate-CoA ligase family protein [Acidimicrobiales bacterium]